jgi:hypothetical protein
MNFHRNILVAAMLCLSLCSLEQASAAKNWIWYFDSASVGSGFVDVTIGIKANQPADIGRLGNHSLRGTMSADIFDFTGASTDPSVFTAYVPTPAYSYSLGNPTGVGNWQWNGLYNGSAGGGIQVTQLGTLVCTIRFYVLNPQGAVTFTLGTLQQTYEDDNITNVAGTYDNSGGIGVPLPITLASFTGQALPNGVRLDWTTLTEINNYGFYVQRRRNIDSLFVDVPNSFIPGHGTTTEPHTYTYTDIAASSGAWYYRLKQMDLDGTVHYSEPIQVQVLTDVKELAPLVFALNQNYPNPFNPQSEIKFSVEATGRTTLQVYNIAGQLVVTLFDDVAEAGQYYRVRFSSENIASGVYFYRLQSGTKSDLKKMLLLK